ncbi:MAG: hypothetical protein ACYDAL_14070 [Candidatus Dormibacteraceae bacterium]
MTQVDIPRPDSAPSEITSASDKSDFDVALAKLKRIPKGVVASAKDREPSTAPDDSAERLRRIEERLLVVEEALHALQSAVSA